MPSREIKGIAGLALTAALAAACQPDRQCSTRYILRPYQFAQVTRCVDEEVLTEGVVALGRFTGVKVVAFEPKIPPHQMVPTGQFGVLVDLANEP